MPRAVRKSVSRCSSRTSGRHRYRKRHRPRDNALSAIREPHLSPMSGNRYSVLRIETPPLTPLPAPPKMKVRAPASIQPAIPVRKIEQEVEVLKQVKVPEANNITPQKPMGIFQHGIRYIMLPLHLLHLRVWGSPSQSSSEAQEKKIPTASPKSEKIAKESSTCSENKNYTSSSSSSSKTSSSSDSSSDSSSSSSISSKSSRMPPAKISSSTSTATSSDAEQIVSVASSVPSYYSSSSSAFSSSAPTVKSSSSNRMNLIPRRILGEEATEDSDEMVTAEEDLDDSSNEQWSIAVSSPSMNMSIDMDSNNNFDKVSPTFTASCALEEPMDVSIEESNFYVQRSISTSPSRNLRANAIKNTDQGSSDTDSSSSSPEGRRSIYQESSNSSVDREIARVFQKTCTSSSSDEDDYGHSNGRRNNPFITRPSNFGPLRSGTRFREAISDAAIRKKRTTSQYDRRPVFQAKRMNRSSSEGRSNDGRPLDLSKMRISRERPLQNSQDSAYSDEDVEMNSINESTIRFQSVHMQSVQENVEWMDQDLEYVADTEDSNDGSPLAGRTRIYSIGGVSSESADQGFVVRINHARNLGMPLGNWNEISGQQRSMPNSPIVPKENGSPLGDCNKISGLENSMLNDSNLPNETRTPLGNWNPFSGLERSQLNSPIAPRRNGTPLTDWNEISGPARSSLNGQIDHKENITPLGDSNNVSGLQISILNSSVVPKQNTSLLGDWNGISGPDGSVNTQISLPQKVDVDLNRQQKNFEPEKLNHAVRVAGKGPPGFPETPQHPAGTDCHCGKPNCFYMPSAVPTDSSAVNWTNNYTKPPSPMRHLYYEYPEFMSPPAEAFTGHQLPYVLIPFPAHLICEELA